MNSRTNTNEILQVDKSTVFAWNHRWSWVTFWRIKKKCQKVDKHFSYVTLSETTAELRTNVFCKCATSNQLSKSAKYQSIEQSAVPSEPKEREKSAEVRSRFYDRQYTESSEEKTLKKKQIINNNKSASPRESEKSLNISVSSRSRPAIWSMFAYVISSEKKSNFSAHPDFSALVQCRKLKSAKWFFSIKCQCHSHRLDESLRIFK